MAYNRSRYTSIPIHGLWVGPADDAAQRKQQVNTSEILYILRCFKCAEYTQTKEPLQMSVEVLVSNLSLPGL